MMQDIWNSSQWNTSPKAYWTMQYEYKRSGADMQYRFYWKVWVGSGSWYYDGLKLKLFLNGVQHDITVKTSQSGVTGWSYDGTTEWYTVSNKTSGTVPFYAQLYNTNTNTTKATSSTYQLNISPSGATITSAPDFNDEQNPTINYSNLAGNSVQSLQVCMSLTGEYADIVGYQDVNPTGTSFTFNLTESQRKFLRKNTTGNSRTVIFSLVTKIDGVYFVSNATRTVNIINASPTFNESNISYMDTSQYVSVTENPLHIVQNKSTLSVSFTDAIANKESTIVGYSINVKDTNYNAYRRVGDTIDFGTINNSKDCEIEIEVTDSRGNKTIATKTITVLAWAEPNYTVKLERRNNYEDTTYLTVNANISSVNEKNSMAISYQVKESGGEYGDITFMANNITVVKDYDKNKAYVFKVQVSDAFSSVSNEYVLSKGRFPLFIDTEKNAIGINEFPAEDEALRVAGGIAHFEDGVKIGDSVIDYTVEQGTSGIWTYEKFASGKAVCWGAKNISNIKITVNWGNIYRSTGGWAEPYPDKLFVDLPKVFFEIDSPADDIMYHSRGNGQTTMTPMFGFWCPEQLSNTSTTLYIHAIGKWK